MIHWASCFLQHADGMADRGVKRCFMDRSLQTGASLWQHHNGRVEISSKGEVQ